MASSVADSSCCDAFGTMDGKNSDESTNVTEQSRLDQSNDSNQDLEEDQTNEDDPALSAGMKEIIQERVQQYKSQMMELWMKEAEEKIAAMEQQYMMKMKATAGQNLYHLSPTRAKGLDRSETFV